MNALVFVATFGAAAMALGAEELAMNSTIPSAAEILKTLRPEHPRLLAAPQDFDELKQRVASDPALEPWADRLRERANQLLSEKPSTHEIPDGLRLLATSRRVLDRVFTLAILYRLDGDRRYAERAWQELEAAARFPDWNPRHFLDTAEMTHALAVGYDWLHDCWTPEQRATLRAAIIEKGLRPALGCYRGIEKHGWWVRCDHNWNQVCNGGIGLGALAIADEEPELCSEILHAALRSLPRAMAEYAPDGAWAEGPGYWHYATHYNVVLLAALESALGTDFGFAQMPGFADTGLFPLYMTGPSGKAFNFADGGDGRLRASELFWLARKFDRPPYAWFQRESLVPSALNLLWFDARGEGPRASNLPLDKHFRHVDVVALRSAWEDPQALFVGFKAGDNKANHSHLDLGSFALDALGQRWAVDLGGDNYNLPQYFGPKRWTYYRLRAEGHNTLVINPSEAPDQEPTAVAPITRFKSEAGRTLVVADLTAAYRDRARRVQRGLTLVDRRQVLVQDEIQTDQPSEVWWFLHTPAAVEPDETGRSALLSLENAHLQARIVSPADAKFSVMGARPLPTSPDPDSQEKNQATRKLAIRLGNVTDVRLAVLLTPLGESDSPPAGPPAMRPLAEW